MTTRARVDRLARRLGTHAAAAGGRCTCPVGSFVILWEPDETDLAPRLCDTCGGWQLVVTMGWPGDDDDGDAP